MSEATGPAENLYEILKSKIDILSNWAESNTEYKDRVNTLVYGFKTLNINDNDAIANFNKAVAEVITSIPPEIMPKQLTANAEPYDGGRRRKSASSSSRPRRRSSKKRGTQRKQKRRQRRGSRRAY